MRRPIAPRIERTTCRLFGVPSLMKPARWLFHLGRLGELRAGQVRQREVVEEDLHELFLGQVEDEIVLALAGVARLALPLPLPPPPLRPLDAVAAHVLLVARMHDLARAALAVAEHRLADVALRDVDVLALLDVADAAAVDRAPHRLADLLLVAAQEALAVADRLVLARQPPIDDLLKHVFSGDRAALDQLLLRTRRYHSHSRRTCFGV